MNGSAATQALPADVLLDRVASSYGIEPEYFDIWGGHHRVSDESRRALLAAMGVEAGSEEGLRSALESVERQGWERLVPPVQVVREGPVIDVVLCLPRADTGLAFEWELILESGQRRGARFYPQGLPERDARDVGGVVYEKRCLTLTGEWPLGYHSLRVRCADDQAGCGESTHMSLIVAPGRCYRPPGLDQEGGRFWGVAVQLYAVRTRRHRGMGNFGDLHGLIDFCADSGADVLALNPVHALFPSDPESASPYGPSNRCFLNVLYVDAGEACAQDAPQAPAGEPGLVDYSAVAASRLSALKHAWADFRAHDLALGSAAAQAFRDFCAERGEALHRHAVHDALRAHLQESDPALWGWPVWPEGLRDPLSEEVREFSIRHAEQVDFHAWMQWQASRQLETAVDHARERGLGIGLMFDLAVGANAAGSEVWARRAVHASAAEIGSPPDDFNLNGQGWGSVPMIPHRLRDEAYATFIEVVRAAMREAGALRIDHVMGLQRLFWIPRDASPDQGAYVRYPFDDLLGIIALESARNACLIVGEDLGTVPEHFRQATAERGLLSYRLLYFERHADGCFRAPSEYPRDALVMTGTHDLPTLAGFWSGLDLEWREKLDLLGHTRSPAEWREARARDRAQLVDALVYAGVLDPAQAQAQRGEPLLGTPCAAATYRYLARTPAALALIQAEDLLNVSEQVNLPATSCEVYPNWRHVLPLELEQWRQLAHARAIMEAVASERGASAARAQ